MAPSRSCGPILIIRGCAVKSLTRTTSRCRWTESIVSLERAVCSCAELQDFSCYRGWKEACQATRAISTTSRRELLSLFFPARQGAEGNSRHSERNIRITCTIVCHRKIWVAQFKRGDFSTCDAPRPGRTKRVFCVANFTVLQRQPIFQASVLIFLRSFGCQSQAYIQTFSFVIRASL